MSGNTGTYRWNAKEGRLEKISDEIPNACVFDCYVPKGGYTSEHIGHRPRFISSRRDKRRIMAREGVREHSELTKREL